MHSKNLKKKSDKKHLNFRYTILANNFVLNFDCTFFLRRSAGLPGFHESGTIKKLQKSKYDKVICSIFLALLKKIIFAHCSVNYNKLKYVM